MDYVGIESIKKAYAQSLIDSGNITRGTEIYNKPFEEPVFEGLAVHPETEFVKDRLISALKDISIDFTALNKEMYQLGENYRLLINNTKMRLSAVEEKLQIEEDRIRDINVICNMYPQFSTIYTLTNQDAGGNYHYENGTFMAAKKTEYREKPYLTVIDVTGNGYEGNKYVMNASSDTSNRDNLTDDNILTKYEYSRLTTQDKDSKFNSDVNVDNEEAKCLITLQASQEINMINITSASDIVIEDVLASNDEGLTYESTMGKEIHINSREHRYDDPEYAYQSGIIAFPNTKFIKLRVRSNGITGDVIAEDTEDESTVNNNVSRHVAKIDLIETNLCSYGEGTIETGELVPYPVGSISIFANEYVPPYFLEENEYFKYVLTVNDKDYDIVPINSNKIGTKVVRMANYSEADNYVTHINESIKTAKLKVIISTYNDATPYLTNLKICYGQATNL